MKNALEGLTSAGRSPEETLQQLDSMKIDWYVTEQGDLMIRYWQIGAEGFVSPEHVGHLRTGNEEAGEIDSLEWVSHHLSDLRARYAGQWIAVNRGRVIASARTLPELLDAYRDSGVLHPFVTQIPAEPVLWTTTYAG